MVCWIRMWLCALLSSRLTPFKTARFSSYSTLNRFLPPCPTALATHKTSRPLHLSLKQSRKVRTVSLLCPRLPHKPHDLRPRSLLRLSPARVAWPKQAQVCPFTLLMPSLHTKTNGRSRRVSLSRRTSSIGLMRVATVSCSVCI